MSEQLANSSTHGVGDSLDRGLAEAFGDTSRPRTSHPSVLKALQARTGSKLGVQLDSQGLEDAPVKVTDEVKALRDPSGRYQLLGEIGRGGMGIVYKGRDQDLGRDVAMKVLKDEYATRADVLARFVEEAQIGGQLQHPGIVPVYELGLQAGERPYFAMKLVKGETLAAQLTRRIDPTQERRRLLGIFEQVCQTVAYAHARHVVHRDLKPANVMIGAFGEVQVVDWGFAKVLQKGGVADEAAAARKASQLSVIETARSRADSGSHSVAGSMMGTPAYMPPEQALGDIARVDERSDVFALGAILCELLTGDAPYRQQDGDLVRQAATAQLDGAHARLANCGADETLVALCKECLAPSQRARPASGAEVAERVSAYLTSVEERARQAEVRAAEARLKHRVTLMSAGAGVLVLALTAGGWIWLDSQARARRSEATQRVASAMSTASAARGRAQSAKLDASLWSTALSSAEQLVALAKSDDVDAKARGDAGALLASVRQESDAANAESERQRRDVDMLAQLEQARIPADEDITKHQFQELQRLDKAYAQAFASYLGGQSLLEQRIDDALTSLRRGDIPVELAASLDHWGLVRDRLRGRADAPDPAGTARVREIAARLDSSDAWRNELRALLPNAADESARLRELAEQADFTTLTPVGCRVLSQALWSAREAQTAVTVLRRGQELYPRDFDLCFLLALFLESLDEPRPAEAVEMYRIAHAIRPEQNEVLHRELIDLLDLGRYADSERLARMLLAGDPNDPDRLFHLGLALSKQRRLDEAVACLRKALELDPKDQVLEAALYDSLGVALTDRGGLEEAITLERQAISLDSACAGFHNNLGNALMRFGRLDEAVASYREAVLLAPSECEYHSNLGAALNDQGKFEEALASLRHALELDPKHARAHNNLGVTLLACGRVDEAIASNRKAVELEPADAVFHDNLGNALSERGDLDGAIASLRRAIECDPRLADAHAKLGYYLQCQGKPEEAVASLRRAIELEPGLAVAHGNLGYSLQALGKFDEALRSSRRAIDADPGYAPGHFNLGAVLQGQRRFEDALESFRRAASIWQTKHDAFSVKWLAKASEQIRKLELEVEREPRLLALARGELQTADAQEYADAAAMVYFRGEYLLAAKTYSRGFDAIPAMLAEPLNRYTAACCAALAGCGRGSGVATLSEAERAALREEARDWLSAAADSWRSDLEGSDGQRREAKKQFASMLADADFAGVRGDEIETLPEGERAAWRALWKLIGDGAAK